MRAHNTNVAGGEGEVGQSLGRFGGIALSLMFGSDAVSDLDHTLVSRRSFEAGVADGNSAVAQHDLSSKRYCEFSESKSPLGATCPVVCTRDGVPSKCKI